MRSILWSLGLLVLDIVRLSAALLALLLTLLAIAMPGLLPAVMGMWALLGGVWLVVVGCRNRRFSLAQMLACLSLLAWRL